MGIFYRSFLKELQRRFESEGADFDEFLAGKDIQDLYGEFEIGEGSLYWALNIAEFCERNGIESSSFLSAANKILADNAREWSEGWP